MNSQNDSTGQQPALTKFISSEDESSLRDILFVLFRHKKKVLFTFWSIYLTVIVWTYLSSEIYESEAKVLIGKSRVADTSLTLGNTNTVDFSDFSKEVESELSILRNIESVGQVVDEIGAEKILNSEDDPLTKGLFVSLKLVDDLSVREKAIKQVMKDLDVEVIQDSNIIQVKFRSQDPQLAQRVLDLTLERYMEQHIKVHTSQVSPQFFQEQAEEKEKTLKKIEDNLEEFRIKHGIASLDKQKELVLVRLDDLGGKLQEAKSLSKAAEVRIDFYKYALEDHDKYIEISKVTGRPNAPLTQIKQKFIEAKLNEIAFSKGIREEEVRLIKDQFNQRIMDLKITEAGRAARYLPGSSEIKEIQTRREILENHLDDYLTEVQQSQHETAREQVKEVGMLLKKEESRAEAPEVTVGVNIRYQELEGLLDQQHSEFRAQESIKKILLPEHDRLTAKKEGFVALEKTLRRMEREAELALKEFEQYRESFQKSLVNAALDQDEISNVNLILEATMPLGTVKPKKVLNLIVGFLLSLFGCIGLAFLVEFFDHSLKSVGEVEKWLELPILTSLTDSDFEKIKNG